MTGLWVELSLENLPLARAELGGAVAALGGRVVGSEGMPPMPGLVEVELSHPADGARLARRLALARRCLSPWTETAGAELRDRLRREGSRGESAAFRPLGGRGRSSAGSELLELAAAWGSGGGRIDLDHPQRRFLVEPRDGGGAWVAEEVAAIDRAASQGRRMPTLPFRRPVSLPPRLAQAAANLARIRPGDRVVDPFVGTGALILEAGLLGARVSGVDRDATMVRGALRNLAHFGLEAERLVVGDAGIAFGPPGSTGWDAILTDPPYGRASGSGGELPETLLRRTLPAWASHVRPGGRVVVVVPGGPEPLTAPWTRVESIPDRVHRSLTREFRVYTRVGDATGA
ncbi:MAG: RsmD family RNA methyltransferase [Thermoplasmata archaeon]|nr:RsmD family RNA methyltransferase [Thermoplasmata archaeon]